MSVFSGQSDHDGGGRGIARGLVYGTEPLDERAGQGQTGAGKRDPVGDVDGLARGQILDKYTAVFDVRIEAQAAALVAAEQPDEEVRVQRAEGNAAERLVIQPARQGSGQRAQGIRGGSGVQAGE